MNHDGEWNSTWIQEIWWKKHYDGICVDEFEQPYDAVW